MHHQLSTDVLKGKAVRSYVHSIDKHVLYWCTAECPAGHYGSPDDSCKPCYKGMRAMQWPYYEHLQLHIAPSCIFASSAVTLPRGR